MPIVTETEYLDGTFTVMEPEPATLAEVVELIGEDAVREQAVSNLYYRNKYPRVYRKVSEAVVASGFARAVKEQKELKDGTKRDVLVDVGVHLRQYLATGEEAKAKLGELFASIGPAEPLYVKGERVGGGGKISQAAQKIANDKFAAGDEVVEATATKIEETVPGYKIGRDNEGAVTPESLARGIQALQKHLEAKAKEQAASLLV